MKMPSINQSSTHSKVPKSGPLNIAMAQTQLNASLLSDSVSHLQLPLAYNLDSIVFEYSEECCQTVEFIPETFPETDLPPHQDSIMRSYTLKESLV